MSKNKNNLPTKGSKFPEDKRAAIPSTEEAGQERDNPIAAKSQTLYLDKRPKNREDDPELFWLGKYGEQETQDQLAVDVRSLYRYEHVAPELIIKNLYQIKQSKPEESLFQINELFGGILEKDELEKVPSYYTHQDGWTNRLIQGDSLLVMTSLLEREGMAGQVQTIFIDPPYGIRYGGNWQLKINNREVKDGKDEDITAEPEQIKAFRDTWQDGIHSYLSYLRDRLLIAHKLLNQSGSCFVQISDENVHLVRCLMDEVFGSENFVSQIAFRTTAGDTSYTLPTMGDFIIWYAKKKEKVKYRKVFIDKVLGVGSGNMYTYVENEDRSIIRKLTQEEIMFPNTIPKNWRVFRIADLKRLGKSNTNTFKFEFEGKLYYCGDRHQWKTTREGLEKLKAAGWLIATSNTLCYKRYFDDFPITELGNMWTDTQGSSDKSYVVQTSNKVIQRCILMTSDPGDLVLDPTCGSGTTAYVCEQFGRRWITIDTSRIAVNIAKQRLMVAVFPYYKLVDELGENVRKGFEYKTVPHVTLKSLANDEPPAVETLYDQPLVDNKKMRVSGTFTVETLQSLNPLSPQDLDTAVQDTDSSFEERVRQHLLSAGIKNGRKDERVVFASVEFINDNGLHAEGYYQNEGGEQKAYFHIGPKFGSISRASVNEAIRSCRFRGDANWLVLLGFSFESNVNSSQVESQRVGNIEITKVRMHDDLLQEGLMKKPPKSAGSFITIGEPDIALHRKGDSVQVEILGLDIYNPIKDTVMAREVHEIAYWVVDDNYDGTNFVVRQVFFCGGKKEEFQKWEKGLQSLALQHAKKKAETTLKIELDYEAIERLYGHISHPIALTKEKQRIAVRIISQFGEESTKVIEVVK
ncbi:site-specific DNA-methyltransferase [Hugenholtzia roseola]|uniref:site-specific DNA-methyltransferase n=1 Tax=Hugenholtzia roseola TaxID=1002 RepID=UPI0003FE74F3|nr:site-specific DNA-methyltransferase [Hugenholtzia roseola]